MKDAWKPERARTLHEDLNTAPGAVKERRKARRKQRRKITRLEQLDAQITICQHCNAQSMHDTCNTCARRLGLAA